MSEEKILTREEIIGGIRALAGSQGLYSRLYDALCTASPEQRECWLSHLLDTHPTCLLDVILYVEGAVASNCEEGEE